MGRALRPVLLSLMLGLLEAMRRAEDPLAAPLVRQWAMRTPLETPPEHPERCWFWLGSPLAN